MANPITAIASRSCAKNSMLKQTNLKQTEPDLSKGSGTTNVSTTADAPLNIGGGRTTYGTQTDTTVTTPGTGGKTETIYDTGKSLKGLTPEQLAWRDNEIKKLGGIDAYHRKYGDPKRGKARQVNILGDKPKETKTSDFEIDQEQVKGQTNLDLRQDIRQEKILNRLERQAERRQDRFERKGLSKDAKKTKRKEQRKERASANIKRQQRVQDLIADRISLRKLQRDQGGFDSGKYYVSKIRENKEGLENRTQGINKRGPIKKNYFNK